jgi:hypothetical protein
MGGKSEREVFLEQLLGYLKRVEPKLYEHVVRCLEIDDLGMHYALALARLAWKWNDGNVGFAAAVLKQTIGWRGDEV